MPLQIVMFLTYCFCCPADLHQMHKLNEEAYTNPEQWQRKAAAAVLTRQTEQPEPIERVSGTITRSLIDLLSSDTIHVQN